MQNREWTFEDKSSWGDGPWQHEPDKAQWTDAATGLPCLLVRNRLGALCGYVGVMAGHPAYQKHYDHVDVDVHGGLTFSDTCSGDEHGICHVVEAGEDDAVWWLGFDCAHYQDIAPAYQRRTRDGLADFQSYKTAEYVRNECASLAQQLAAQARAQALHILNCGIHENGSCLANRDAEGRIVDEHGQPMVADDEVSE